MDKRPHKSSWTDRKRRREPDIQKKEEVTVMDSDVREQLNKIKKYAMICAIVAIARKLLLCSRRMLLDGKPYITSSAA